MTEGDDAERRFEREGLLQGAEEGDERAARVQLLERLETGGVSVEKLRQAVQEDRLALVPVERALVGEVRYTLEEVAESSGLEQDFLREMRGALGLPREVGDGPMADEEALEAATTLKRFRDAGASDEDLLEAARVIGRSAASAAAALRGLVGSRLIQAGDSEQDLGLRYADAADSLLPLAGPLNQLVLRLHMLEQVRSDGVTRAERASGVLSDSRPLAVAFADLVGFTRLGERLSPAELGHVARRLEEMASEVTEAPVRLIKALGDGVLLSSPDTPALLESLFELVDTVDREDDDFPQVTVGVAHGAVLPRSGDVYGKPVNLASRLASVARPGTIVADGDAREAAEGAAYRFSAFRPRRLKGLQDRITVHRVRREDETDGEDDGG